MISLLRVQTEQLFRDQSSVSKLSGSGQGFSLTSFEKRTAGWIHKKSSLLNNLSLDRKEHWKPPEGGQRWVAQACLGRYLQAIPPPDLSGTRRRGSCSAGRHLAPAWELGGEVGILCQSGSIRASWEQMFCGVFAPVRLWREDVSISGCVLPGEQQILTLRLPHVNPRRPVRPARFVIKLE